MLTTLAACNDSSSVRFVQLPGVPEDVKECFERLVPAPKAKKMTSKEVFSLISELRRSELEKAQCGSRVVSLWEDYRAAYKD
jgi:hypothetical protein